MTQHLVMTLKGDLGLYTEFHVDNLYAKTSGRIQSCGRQGGYMSALIMAIQRIYLMIVEEWSIEKNIKVPSKSTVYTAMTVPEFIAKKKIACQHDRGKPLLL